MKAYDLIVRGRVQRVGYRRYLLDTAQELELAGYAENNMDGTVHIFIQGPGDKLNKFIDKARKPEYPAKVIDIEVREAEPNPDYKYFLIRFGSMEEELQEGFGAMQSIFIEYWREFRDYRNEFREFAERTDKNFQILMEKYGEISAKLTEIMTMLLEESSKTREMLMEIRRESSETRKMLNESIKLLRKAVEKLGKS